MHRSFLAHFLKNPKAVGAICPLSHSVASQLTKYLKERPNSSPCNILEIGAGTGNITKSIVSNMTSKDHLDVVELDGKCCRLLKNRYASQENIHVECCSIVNWKPPYTYDFIISTLPFNSLPTELVKDIMKHYQSLSNSNTIYAYVEYVGLQKMSFIFSTPKKRENIKEKNSFLRHTLNKYLIDKSFVLTNFLPCQVYYLKLDPA